MPIDFEKLRVRDVMTTEVVTVDRRDKLASANDVMTLGRIRHMPVVDEDGGLVGIITQRDLFHNMLLRALGYGAHAASRAREMFEVKQAMSHPVITTSPNTPISEAASRMLDEKVGCLVVVEGGTIVGIITESDFVRLAASERDEG